MSEIAFNIKKLKEKVVSDKPLTRREERFYMIHVLKVDAKSVENIFAINDNKNPNLIID